MTTADTNIAAEAEREARRERRFTRINSADKWFQVIGLAWLTPILKATAGDNPKAQMGEIWRLLGVPLLAIAGFIALWAALAPTVQTSLGAIPGPAQVWTEAVNLHEDAQAKAASRAKFEAQVATLNERRIEQGKEPVERAYTGAPSYYSQIWTSIKTVFFGFLIASVVAIPLGIAAGLVADRDHGRLSGLHHLGWSLRQKLPDLGHHGNALFALADADQYGSGRVQHRQGFGQRLQGPENVHLDQDHQACASVRASADLHWPAPLAWCWLDGADRR